MHDYVMPKIGDKDKSDMKLDDYATESLVKIDKVRSFIWCK
jgi:hypothetical protein